MRTADDVLREDFLDGLDMMPIGEVRELRAACLEVETALSYVRRIVHGRLDIVANERSRREGGVHGDLHSLVEDLPAILAEKTRSTGPGRLVQVVGPTDAVEPMLERLDEIAPPSVISDPTSASDEDLADQVARLTEFEADLSAKRHALHHTIDALQAEITRRYRTGEANIDALLQ